jgi:subtilisin-like proprotein convertase family protein
MKKLLTVCIMLALVASAAFAGTTYQKEQLAPAQAKEVVDLEKALNLYNEGLEMTDAEKAAVVDYLGLDREVNVGDGLDAVGGPNTFGYQWVDNMGGDTATYNWIELSTDPGATPLIAINKTDDAARPCTLSFNFPYYGGSFNIVRPATNGQIAMVTNNTSFTNACGGTFTSQSMPVIFALWDDWHTDRGGLGGVPSSDSGAVYFRDFGTYAVIQWDSVGRSGVNYLCSSTFQAILFNDGKIKLQYKQIEGSTSPSATIGIKDANTPGPLDYLQYICNTAADPTQLTLGGRAVWFYIGAPQTGRCCYLQGGAAACADLLLLDCQALGGQFTPGTSCAAAPCPTGRCCYLDMGRGDCATNTQLECNALGGTWTAGQNCVDNPCQVGRCCYNGGASCGDVQSIECTFLGGTWNATLSCATSPCPVAIPGGSDCASAVAVPVPGAYSGTTTGGTDSDPGIQCALGSTDPYEGTNTAPDKWYSVVGTGNTMTVSLCNPGTAYDTQIAVFCGDCSGLNCVAGNDDAGSTVCTLSGLRSVASFCSNFGQVYYVVVDGWGTGNGAYELSISDDGVPCTGAVNCSPEGRCCYTDITGQPACADVTAAECEILGGVFDALSTCASGPCGGSCCYVVEGEGFCSDQAVCVENVLERDCDLLGGSWNAGLSCAETPCQASVPCVCNCSQYPNSHSTLALDETTYPIVSNTPTTCLTVNVPVEYHITDLNVCIDLVHTFDGDLIVSVQSPLGTVVVLSNHRGGGGDNFFCTEFDDEATLTIGSGTAPFSGSWIPDNALSAFDGENAVGDWLVCVDDQVGGDDGYVIGACLKFEYDEILPVAFGGFDAVAGNGMVTVNWNTLSENNVDHFELSRDGAVVANVAAENNASGASYSYVDNDVTNGVEYNYSLVSVDVNGARQDLATMSATPTGAAVVNAYALHQNYPNPFNPTTNIVFDMVEAGHATISVYNIMGQKVAELVNGAVEAGRHTVTFDATSLSSGLYLYKMEANGFTAQSKMVLMK